MEFEQIVEEFKRIEEVKAIVLGGSRAKNTNDEKSDYDVYIYYDSPVSKEIREEILKKYCKHMEIAVNYFEEEDDCIMNSDVAIELIYRQFDTFEKSIMDLLSDCFGSLGYSTCFLDNVVTSKLIYDRDGKFERLQKQVYYPKELQRNIIRKNMDMLSGVMASYDLQIKKAISRGDKISINHRIAAYLASYFDIIFAVNLVFHPGEKRLIQMVNEKCKIIPEDFEKNIELLLNQKDIENTLKDMYEKIKKIVNI